MDPLMSPWMFPPDQVQPSGVPAGGVPAAIAPLAPTGTPPAPTVPPPVLPGGGAGMGAPIYGGPQSGGPMGIPEMIASAAASAGIRPSDFLKNPQMLGPLFHQGPQAPQSGGPPMDIRPEAQKAGGAGEDPQRIRTGLDALRGIKAPAGPTPQTVRSPAAPHPTAGIKGGDLIQLLMSLGLGRGGQAGPQTPPTLGASLRGLY